MAGAVEQIKREILALEQIAAKTAIEFQDAYADYLLALGQVTQQQLILATYHLCTQGYPEQFLNLSRNQRQLLQQTVRTIAQQTQEHLTMMSRKFEHLLSPEPGVGLAYDSGISYLADAVERQKLESDRLTPEDLVQCQQRLEQMIVEQLQEVSCQVNNALQKLGVIPQKLPEPVMAAIVAKSGEATEVMAKTPPNILRVLVEPVPEPIAPDQAENKSAEDSDHAATQPPIAAPMYIMAIHLQLAEMEFADSTLMVKRNKIRSLAGRLKALRQDYRRKQHELTISEAEVAWRMSWD